uniref:Uncharacterized protein n=1 Tax=Opuntia streptacantha TaxID=393608 RepID=A0A7C9EDL1_OPUST
MNFKQSSVWILNLLKIYCHLMLAAKILRLTRTFHSSIVMCSSLWRKGLSPIFLKICVRGSRISTTSELKVTMNNPVMDLGLRHTNSRRLYHSPSLLLLHMFLQLN